MDARPEPPEILKDGRSHLLAWDHMALIFDEIEAAGGRVTNDQLLELESLNEDFSIALQLLTRNNVIQRGPDEPFLVLDPNAFEVLSTNFHCNCTDFAASVFGSCSKVGCAHHLAVRLFLVMKKND